MNQALGIPQSKMHETEVSGKRGSELSTKAFKVQLLWGGVNVFYRFL